MLYLSIIKLSLTKQIAIFSFYETHKIPSSKSNDFMEKDHNRVYVTSSWLNVNPLLENLNYQDRHAFTL